MTTVAMVSMHTSPLAQPGTGDAGGMNVFVRELGAALAQAGVPVRVFVRRSDSETVDRVQVEPGFEVVQVPVGPLEVPKHRLLDWVEPFTDWVEGDLDRTGDVSVLHANYWLSGIAAHALKHRRGLPLVSTFHTLGRVKRLAGDVEPVERIDAESSIIGCSDLITAATPIETAELVELYGARPERIELVTPGVDRAFFSPGDRRGARAALGLDDRPMVLFVGRLQPLKGAALAVEALAALRSSDAQLVVVGGPSGAEGDVELAQIRSVIDTYGLERRVRFVPPQPHHLLSSFYRAANVCVVPSRSESFGLVALEAAACGVPVVASDVGGLRSLVRPGDTGVLVGDRSPAAFAAAIDQLLGDPVGAAAMGDRAAQRAAEFAWSRTAARLRRVFADLANRPALVECRA